MEAVLLEATTVVVMEEVIALLAAMAAVLVMALLAAEDMELEEDSVDMILEVAASEEEAMEVTLGVAAMVVT